MRYIVLLLTNIIVVIINFDSIDSTSESNGCSDQEYSPLCFCHSSDRHSILTDRFLAKIYLFQCDDSFPIRHCRQSRLHSPLFNLTQLTNLSHCFEDIHCLHKLHSTKYCRRCQLTSLLSTHNTTYRTDACFNFCEQNPSCGFVCLNQPVIISINCNICQDRKQNISCRCIKIKQSLSCLPSSYETTKPRWMQKRGFPAAGILALLMLAGALLVIALKLTYRQLDAIDRRRSIANQQLILLNQTRQLSSNTPQIIDVHRCNEKKLN